MRLPRCKGAEGPFLLMAPALGTLLSLVFFLLLGGYFTLQPGLELKVPDSPFLLLPQHDPKVVSVTGAPLPQIYFDQQVVTTAAMLDRLLHRSVVINLDGDSYRLREHQARNETLRQTTTGTRAPLQ